jgi:hypothetical protein
MADPKQTPKKISRRDAIKLLGAATGATILANLPAKWDTPEAVSGVLPAHAQTSGPNLSILSCDLNVNLSTGAWSSTVYTGPIPFTGTPVVQYTLTFVNMYFANQAPGPQSPNPIISNRNLDSNGEETINGSDGPVFGLDTLIADPTAASGSFTVLWEFLDQSHGTGTCSQTFNWSFSLPTVDTTLASNQGTANGLVDFGGEVISDGGSTVTARGFVWSTSPGPTLPTNNVPNGSGIGTFTSTNVAAGPGLTIYVRAYATNAVGTAYGDELSVDNTICLAEGTLITLADGNTKKIEDINYSDMLSVWNFDEGNFDSALPLWIKKAEVTNRFNLLEFSDGSSLKTINQHRIFNKEMSAFTYPMTEDTPIGTTTFNVAGEEVTLIGKRVVNEKINYYNVITRHHMNLFANGILTSCRYNNIYPIVGMKFVKDERTIVAQAEYGVEDKYYEGLRLAEQTIPVDDTIAYVDRLKARELETKLVVV